MGKRRRDLPKELEEREEILRQAMLLVVQMFPTGTGLLIMAFDFGDTGHMSYISNAQREGMIEALREQLQRLEMGTHDTAGREA